LYRVPADLSDWLRAIITILEIPAKKKTPGTVELTDARWALPLPEALPALKLDLS
jgi:hypothetical protein